MTFHHLTLHALIHLSGAERLTWAKLRECVPTILQEDMQPAIDRGWVRRRAGTGAAIYEATDEGQAWARKLCDISEEQPKANQL